MYICTYCVCTCFHIHMCKYILCIFMYVCTSRVFTCSYTHVGMYMHAKCIEPCDVCDHDRLTPKIVYICMYFLHICTYVQLCNCGHMHVFLAHMYVCTIVCMCMYIRMYVCSTGVCICIHSYMNIHIHIYEYTHTHT